MSSFILNRSAISKLNSIRNNYGQLLYNTSRSLSHSQINFQQPKATQSSNNQSQKPPNYETPKSSGGGGGGLKMLAFALSGFALGIGYISLNPESRKQVETYVPQSKTLFEMIDSMLLKKNDSTSTPSTSSSKSTSSSTEIIKKKPETSELKPLFPSKEPVELKKPEAAKKPSVDDLPVVPQKKPASQPSPAVETTTKQSSPAAAAADNTNQPNDLDWRKTMKKAELKTEATISAVETRLAQMIHDVKLRVTEALNSSYVSIESLNKYKSALKKALDDDQVNINKDQSSKELEWRQVTDLFDIQSRDVNETNLKNAAAKKVIDDLDALLKEVKMNDELYNNVKNLRETQLELLNQARLLQSEKTKLNEALIHANVLKNYTGEQKLAREQFLKEIQSLQPEGIYRNANSGDQLSNDELNSLLIHAHKRVLQLQKQIEKMQQTQNRQIEQALNEQQKQSAELRRRDERNLYEINQKEFQLEKDKTIEAERAKANESLRRELARQAVAHNNHLAEMLRIQNEELESLHKKQLLIEIDKTRNEFFKSVASGVGRLRGIENAINKRANLELQANNAKQLWLSLQTLNDLLSSRMQDLDLKDVDANKTNLVSALAQTVSLNLKKIKDSAPDNEFIQNIVDTAFKSLNASRGQNKAGTLEIWTEPDLKDRFYKLKEICDRVALIDDRGGSLFKYMISYIQSFFIIHHKVKPIYAATASDEEKLEANEQFLKQIEVSKLNTFSILDYAEYFIENGDLVSALKLMQQLNGEPLRVSKDWINDALLLVEVKQAFKILNSYISSIYIGTRVNQ